MKIKISTRENNCMSLSCRGEIEFNTDNNIISSVSFKGYPRTKGDRWTSFYKNSKIGEKITKNDISYLLSFDGKKNVRSVLLDEKNNTVENYL